MNLTELQIACHNASHVAGWWHHPDSGLPYIPGDAPTGDEFIQWRGLVEPTKKKPSWEYIDCKTRQMIIHYWPFVLATKIALIHSEVSEGLEGLRKNLMDDKLTHRLGLETELADSLIRTFDIGGAIERARFYGIVAVKAPFDLHSAVGEKMSFNAIRPDHKVTARNSTGGKSF